MRIVSKQKLLNIITPITAAFFMLTVLYTPYSGMANMVDDFKKSIDQKNEEIKKLEEEAKKYRTELASNQQMGKNLKQELNRIERNVKKLQNDIAVTQSQIKRAELEITKLAYEIADKEASIKKLHGGLASLLKNFFESERNATIELLLRQSAFSQFFQLLNSNASIEKKVLASLDTLHDLHKELEYEKNEQQIKRDESRDLNDLLHARKLSLITQRGERNTLLSVTKTQEKLYQQLLKEQEKKRVQLEQEVDEIEEKIRVIIDPSSLPAKGTGVLGWPLVDLSKESCWSSIAAAKNCITQFFGYTSFAAVGGYGGKGHNGADFRADVGTPLLAVEKGIVTDVGDTDVGCRGASYGKWILIKHPNNLSTLYAHLSHVSVRAGQEITRGLRIGLTGKSGYATGPHLHMSVFATQGVSIQSIKSKVCGRMMTLPIAATNAYLNPLDYL